MRLTLFRPGEFEIPLPPPIRSGPNRVTLFLAEFAPLPATHWLANLSARVQLGSGDDAVIAGFISRGGPAKRVLIRALGSSLGANGVVNALGDPVLDLYSSTGELLGSNDNWRSDQEAEIIATTIPPSDDKESAILATLAPGFYTAIVRGKHNTTGIALVEAYQLDN